MEIYDEQLMNYDGIYVVELWNNVDFLKTSKNTCPSTAFSKLDSF
jgi:hypothetical protein